MDSDAAIRPGASPVRAPDRDLHLSPMSRSTNGRPEPEVIVQVRIPEMHRRERGRLNSPDQYLDGFAYNKVKMEEAFLPGGFLAEKVAQKPHTPAKDPNVKKEDVDLIVRGWLL